MGCGGSKQQDVATGNTVSTGKLSQKEAAASKSKASSTTTEVSSADDSLKSIVEKVEMVETNDGLQGNEKPATATVVEVTEEEQPTTNETPNEYLSPRKDAVIVEAAAGGGEVDYLSLRKDHDANVVEEEGMEKELKEIETTVQEEEKEEVGLKNDDDGDSIGKSSNDFKETLSVEEMDEVEVVIAEKETVGEGELLSGSSAP